MLNITCTCRCLCAVPHIVAVSVTGNAGIGMPIILLHDAEGGIVTVELKNGEVYRGLLDEAEDSMNLVLKVRTEESQRLKTRRRKQTRSYK